MASLNKVQLIGNLGRDPEVHDFDNNKKKVKLSLATTENYQSNEGQNISQTEWHNVILWSPLAEIAEKYLSKGRQVYVEGKIRSRSYEDKQGETRRVTEIIGRRLILLGGRQDAANVSVPEDNKAMSSADNEDEDDGLPF